MGISRFSRSIMTCALAAGGLLATSLISPPAHAAGTAPRLQSVVLVVESTVRATGLSQAQALARGSALLPLVLRAPAMVPAGSHLVSVSIQPPVYHVTHGSATLIYGSPSAGVTFSLQETAFPVTLLGMSRTPVLIDRWAGMLTDLGSAGTSHLLALTWSNREGSFDIISNVSKSHLGASSLLAIARAIH